MSTPHKPPQALGIPHRLQVLLTSKLGLTRVLCPGTATACTALSQGTVPSSHFSGEKHRGKGQTQRHKSAFFQAQRFQGAPVPPESPTCDGRSGKEQAPSGGSRPVRGASRHLHSEPCGDNISGRIHTASLLPEAAFITSMSLMKRRLCFLGSMNPRIVTCLLSGKSGLSLPELV